MRYQTDSMTQSEEKCLRSRKVSILDIFWHLIMLIMQKWDFSGTWDILQMLLNTLYFHYMRYRTDRKTRFWENWLRSQKTKKKSILAKQNVNNNFFNFLKTFFGPAVFCKRFYPFYTCIICSIGPIRRLKIEKSGLEVKKSENYFPEGWHKV